MLIYRSDSSGGFKRAISLRAAATIFSALFFCGNLSAEPTFAQAVDFDLSSTQRTQASELPTGLVSIRVDGRLQSVSPQGALTAAERIAVIQVLASGRQSLAINSAGSAIGGQFRLNGDLYGVAQSLSIPAGVTALGDFATVRAIDVIGTLTNGGRIFAYSTSPSVTSATIQAANIVNLRSGLISTLLPNSLSDSLGASRSPFDLNLVATNSMVNAGLISSSGKLSVSNPNGPLNFNNQGGAVLAKNDVSFGSPGDVLVTSLNGVIHSELGSINIRDIAYNGSGQTILSGGNWLSHAVNIHAGEGTVNTAVENMSGLLNLSAREAHVLANTPTLSLGEVCVTGDPTYVNMGGDIRIVGTITSNESLAIVARGDILAAGPAKIVNLGHDVWMIAGAVITSASCVGCANAGSVDFPPGAITAGAINVTAAGAPGGNIDLATGNTLSSGTVIDTSNAIGSAGVVHLMALANGSVGGQILFPTNPNVASINTSGVRAGNINITAGALSGTGVVLGKVNSSGGAAGTGGNIFINTETGAAFNGGLPSCLSCMSFNASGQAIGGKTFGFISDAAIRFTNTINTGAESLFIQTGTLDISGDLITSGLFVGASGAITTGTVASTGNEAQLISNAVNLTSQTGIINVRIGDTPSTSVALRTPVDATVRGSRELHFHGIDVRGLTVQSAGDIHLSEIFAGPISVKTDRDIIFYGNYGLDSPGSSIQLVANEINLPAGTNISVSGPLAGRIDLQADVITIGGQLRANSTAPGQPGGLIQLTSPVAGAGPVRLFNNGIIEATSADNTSGVIGLNGGSQAIRASGTGTYHAGGYLGVGNLDPVTLAVTNSADFLIASSSDNFVYGDISVARPGAGTLVRYTVTPSTPPPSTGPTLPNLPAPPQPPALPPISTVMSSPPASFPVPLIELLPGGLLQVGGLQLTLSELQEFVLTRFGNDGRDSFTVILPTDQTPVNKHTDWNDENGTTAADESSSAGQNTKNKETAHVLVWLGDENADDQAGQKEQGTTLYFPTEDFVLRTSFCEVHIAAGAAVLVNVTADAVSVYDLADDSSGDVRVVAGNHFVTLEPGKQLTLSSGNDNSKSSKMNVAHRNPIKVDFRQGMNGELSDFSIPAALENSKVYSKLAASPGNAAKSALNKILKTAASVHLATAHRGRYHSP